MRSRDECHLENRRIQFRGLYRATNQTKISFLKYGISLGRIRNVNDVSFR
jgi:hypothetical protein